MCLDRFLTKVGCKLMYPSVRCLKSFLVLGGPEVSVERNETPCDYKSHEWVQISWGLHFWHCDPCAYALMPIKMSRIDIDEYVLEFLDTNLIRLGVSACTWHSLFTLPFFVFQSIIYFNLSPLQYHLIAMQLRKASQGHGCLFQQSKPSVKFHSYMCTFKNPGFVNLQWDCSTVYFYIY